MLFDDLNLLIHIDQVLVNDESLKTLVNEIKEEDIKIFDKITLNAILKYSIKLTEICGDNRIIQYNLFINQYKIQVGNYKEVFEVSNKYYKYFVCVIFLDNNSIIKFFNKTTYLPKCGEIYMFPSAWFFVFEIIQQTNTSNKYIISNLINSYNK
jgi:hypothetical protein